PRPRSRRASAAARAAVGRLGLASVAVGVAGAAPKAEEEEGGWLGVEVVDVSERVTAHFGLAVTSGAVVLRVEPKSPAQEGGVLPGDVIQWVNGGAIADADALEESLEDMGPGSEVILGIARGTESLSIVVTLGEKPKPPKRPHPKEDVPPGLFNSLAHRILNGQVLSGEFEVLGDDGQVMTVKLTAGKVVGVTGTTLTIERADGQELAFETTEDTVILVAGYRINLAGLRAGTPVVVVQKDGVVTHVIAWPGDRRGPFFLPDKPGEGPKHLEAPLFSEITAEALEGRLHFQLEEQEERMAKAQRQLEERMQAQAEHVKERVKQARERAREDRDG
ncbi:MAG: PDZ domain-containing protein, partial [Chloroflexi bacterium]|nr:PDZ domain-containing protein [Chloroflexota bacterium]